MRHHFIIHDYNIIDEAIRAIFKDEKKLVSFFYKWANLESSIDVLLIKQETGLFDVVPQVNTVSWMMHVL